MNNDDLEALTFIHGGVDNANSRNIMELIAALRAAQARVAELEAAARIDIDAANAECASRDCKAWTSRGMTCKSCPCDTVSEIASVMGSKMSAAQRLSDTGKVTP